MAGIVFTSETHLLMGYQPSKMMISGIGGKPKCLEPLIHTALRETIEELFGINPTQWLLISLAHIFVNNARIVQNDGYTMFILSFDQLLRFMVHVEASMINSPYYAEFPKSIHDLILKRRAPPDAEVTHLALIPLVSADLVIDQRDIRHIIV